MWMLVMVIVINSDGDGDDDSRWDGSVQGLARDAVIMRESDQAADPMDTSSVFCSSCWSWALWLSAGARFPRPADGVGRDGGTDVDSDGGRVALTLT